MTGSRSGRAGILVVPALWLTLFFALPFALVVAISLAEMTIGIPPYKLGFHTDNFALLAEDALYRSAYANSLRFAGLATLVCALIGYPMAYAIARAPAAARNLLLMLVILPFWTSFLIRVYAWMGLLRPNGLINELLLWLGLVTEPLPLINNAFSVVLGLVYSYLPFFVLPLYATLERLDATLLEAAADLGATPLRAFLRVTLPLSLPGVVAGALLVFIPAVGEFVIPDLLGGPDTLMIGKVLWDEFFTNRDWPVAAALAVAILALLVVPVAFARRFLAAETR
jgi:putrescine transport system permease protein